MSSTANLGMLHSLPALNQKPLPEIVREIGLSLIRSGSIHQPGNELIGAQFKVHVRLRMLREPQLALDRFQWYGGTTP